ncbi:MAG: M55 family metallopeptidase [Gemmatimonadaceae bacterium]
MVACRISIPIALFLFSSCGPAPAPTPSNAEASAPWTLDPVTADTTDGIRILILHDMEGLSGQSDPATFNFGDPAYPEGQRLLVADVNAVVEGLYVGGATEVRVVDGHGSGNPEPDVRRDLLDQRATQILRDETFDGYFGVPEFERFDGVAVVGMHAKTGSRGFASHTFTLGIGIAINGQLITETELVGLSWGRVGVPVIFGSGDDRLAADLATMPWIEFTTVKQALAADSAAPRPVAEARAELTAKAKLAVENLKAGKARSMRANLPLRVGLRAVPPASLAALDGLPGVQYADSTATFPVDSLKHGYDVLLKLVGIATQAYARALPRVIAERPGGPAVMASYWDRLGKTWFDYESGRWKPDTTRAPSTATPRKYHGYR